MADGLIRVSNLPDPIGEVLSMQVRPNGLTVGEKSVPLGVIGMIYESQYQMLPQMLLDYALRQEMP